MVGPWVRKTEKTNLQFSGNAADKVIGQTTIAGKLPDKSRMGEGWILQHEWMGLLKKSMSLF